MPKRSARSHFPAILALAALLSACMEEPAQPSFAQGLPGDAPGASAAFDARIRAHYPVGSEEALMVGDLDGEGFSFSDDLGASQTYHHAASAVTRVPKSKCVWSFLVQWNSLAGRVTAVTGSVQSVCPNAAP